MLGQHPEAYGLPELNLFVADKVAGLIRKNEARDHAMHGLLRLLAQLHSNEQTATGVDEARQWLEAKSDWSTAELFTYIREQIDPLMAVEKSSRTALQFASLERAFNAAPEASFLHLTRHPRASGLAMLESLDKDIALARSGRQVDPETLWSRAHENINEFTAGLALAQCMRIRVEDLFEQPEFYLEQIVEWLELDTSPTAIQSMLHPEKSEFACYGPDNANLGADPDFLDAPELAGVSLAAYELAGPLEWSPESEFSAETQKLAKEMGYF